MDENQSLKINDFKDFGDIEYQILITADHLGTTYKELVAIKVNPIPVIPIVLLE